MVQLVANGLWFELDVAGTGPPLLFLGGTGWDLRLPPTPLSSPLTEHFTVALYDQRGMGRSSKPPGPYSMHAYAEDAIGILDTLAWPRAHVVGYSFGGMVAQELAIRAPTRVDRLVLAATSSGGAGGASYPIHELLHLRPEERARQALKVADTRFTDAFQRAHPDEAQRRIEKKMRAQTRFMDEPGAREGLRCQLEARRRHDCFDRLGRISATTLVLAGTFDGQAPASVQAALVERIPGAEFALVEGSHNFIHESGEAHRVILQFLQRATG